jgi:hypothetical protein
MLVNVYAKLLWIRCDVGIVFLPSSPITIFKSAKTLNLLVVWGKIQYSRDDERPHS